MPVVRFSSCIRTAFGPLAEENKTWQKTTSCPSRRTNTSYAARPAAPFLAWLTTSPTLVLARGCGCIGVNAASAFGRKAGIRCPDAARLHLRKLKPQDHLHGR